ncbi:MAG: hypothetical protein ACRYFU_16820 [Janthinobacterium lividum]
MSTLPSVYTYSPQQARVIRLYDEYRSCLMNAKYYGRHLSHLKLAALFSDILVVLGTSSAFAGLAIWKNHVGANVWSAVLAMSVLIAALRPILKITDQIDRYAKLQYGYLEVFYRLQSLTGDIRDAGGMNHDLQLRATELDDRYRALEMEDDAYQNPKKMLKAQDEVERSIPSDSLWLPQEA